MKPTPYTMKEVIRILSLNPGLLAVPYSGQPGDCGYYLKEGRLIGRGSRRPPTSDLRERTDKHWILATPGQESVGIWTRLTATQIKKLRKRVPKPKPFPYPRMLMVRKD